MEWNSSDAEVAGVDGAGVVTANGPGQAIITATYQGVRGDATVIVNTPVE
ncbi:Ig-like domain-containing protein [Kocuria sp. NPDC057446]